MMMGPQPFEYSERVVFKKQAFFPHSTTPITTGDKRGVQVLRRQKVQ